MKAIKIILKIVLAVTVIIICWFFVHYCTSMVTDWVINFTMFGRIK